MDDRRPQSEAAASAQRLGVPLNASLSRLRAAYHTQALHWHPDRNADPSAHDKFREAREAYRTLAEAQEAATRDRRNGQAQPVRCQHCGAGERPLKIVTVTRLRTYVLFSRMLATHEVCCRPCGHKQLLVGSFGAGTFGSWSPIGLPLAILVSRRNASALRQSGRLHLQLTLDQPRQPLSHDDVPGVMPWPLFYAANVMAAIATPAIIAAAVIFWFA